METFKIISMASKTAEQKGRQEDSIYLLGFCIT